jgi:hypothetical protein
MYCDVESDRRTSVGEVLQTLVIAEDLLRCVT